MGSQNGRFPHCNLSAPVPFMISGQNIASIFFYNHFSYGNCMEVNVFGTQGRHQHKTKCNRKWSSTPIQLHLPLKDILFVYHQNMHMAGKCHQVAPQVTNHQCTGSAHIGLCWIISLMWPSNCKKNDSLLMLGTYSEGHDSLF